VGSAGGMSDDLKLLDIVIAMGACTDSNFAHQFGLMGTFAPIADYELMSAAIEAARARGLSPRVGNLLSSDNFYSDGTDDNDRWKKMGVLAVEMEAAGLYMNAARCGKRAVCICTISDHLYRPEALSAQERQLGFAQMIETALDAAAAMADR